MLEQLKLSKESDWKELIESNSRCRSEVDIDGDNAVNIYYVSFPEVLEDMIQKRLSLLLDSKSINKIIFRNCHFGKVQLDGLLSSTSFSLIYEFWHCTFNKEVSFSGLKSIKFKSGCIFKEIASFVDYDFDSEYELYFNDVTFEHRLNLTELNYNLENFEFNSIDLSSALLSLSKVSFTKDINFSRVVWPKPENIKADRETFRQLKVCMEESRNAIQANVFHSLEMNEYGKELRAQQTTEDNFQDKFVFFWNGFLSDYSLSWLRPLGVMLGVSIVFFLVADLASDHVKLSFNDFFQFINPFNRSSSGGYANIYAWWFLHKVLMIPLVYLLVVALKRKTKY